MLTYAVENEQQLQAKIQRNNNQGTNALRVNLIVGSSSSTLTPTDCVGLLIDFKDTFLKDRV